MTTQKKLMFNSTSITKFMKNYEMENNNEHNINDNLETIENRNGEIEVFYQEVGNNVNVINMYPNANGGEYSGYSSKKIPIEINNDYNIKNIYLTTFDNGRIVVFYINGDYIKYIYENEETDGERWVSSEKKYHLPKYHYDNDGVEYIINEMSIKTIEMDGKEVIEISSNYFNIKKQFHNTVNSNNRKNIINKSKINKVDDNFKKSLNITNEKAGEPNINFDIILSTITKEGHEVTNSILIGNNYDELINFNIIYDTYNSDYMFICHIFSMKYKVDSYAYYFAEDCILDGKIKKIEKLKQIEYSYNGKKKSKIYCKIYTEYLHQYIVSLRIDGDRVLVDKVISEKDLNITPKGRDIFDFKLSLDSKNRTHLFLDYNEDKSRIHESVLYHMMEYNNSPKGWSEPTRINTQVMSYDNTAYSTLLSISGGVNVFFVDKNNTFIRSMWSRENDQWIISDITPGIEKSIKEFFSYSTELYIKDKAGFPLTNEPVKISSSAQTKLMINGDTYFLGEYQEIEIKTNARGSFIIIQPAEQLGVAALSFTLPQRDPSPVAIRQYADIKKRLSTLTGDELINAKDSEGNPLLPNKIKKKVADSVVDGVKKCMELVDTAPKLRSTFKKDIHVGKYLTETLRQLETLNVPEQYQPWMLDLSAGIPIYRELNEKDIQDKLTNLFGLPEWFGDIGDFILNVKNKIFEIGEFVVNEYGKAVKCTFTFFEEGVKKIFNAVVKFASDALNLASEIFNSIKLTIDKIIEWIGFVFDWKDIMRTKKAISHLLSMQKGALTGMIEKEGGEFEGILRKSNEIDNNDLDKVIKCLEGKNVSYYNSKMELYESKNNNIYKDIEQAFSNNFLLEKFIKSNNNDIVMLSNENQVGLLVDSSHKSIDDFIKNTEEYSGKFLKSKEYKSVCDKLTKHQDIDSILSMTMIEVFNSLKSLMDEGIKYVIGLFKSVMEIIKSIVDKFYSFMDTPLEIPFVSKFFKFITNTENNPSLNDFLSLIIAIPTTILSKLVLGTQLFSNEESILKFKKEISLNKFLDIINPKDNHLTVLTKCISKIQNEKYTKDSENIKILKILSTSFSFLSSILGILRVFAFTFSKNSGGTLQKFSMGIINIADASISTINLIITAFYSFNSGFSLIIWIFYLFLTLISLLCGLILVFYINLSDPEVVALNILTFVGNIICGLFIFIITIVFVFVESLFWMDAVLGISFGIGKIISVGTLMDIRVVVITLGLQFSLGILGACIKLASLLDE
ncbi:hypothetical protein [Xenorhabdus sp. KK7.4]|uniref:hypothetical protein n=1 Tax=Xenorhabdus sp. KK7.4 TaxID=1851572 RepID=UPI000C049EA2|nr:hypothetical protein [Xenorhabdus sp. KK7.4]PHM55822.1 hypothetical protein Xekk_02160 [Xenorhabdus sp. KK7.4]